MLKQLVIALAAVWGIASAQNVALTTGTTTTYQIGDDGYANVPLPFTFKYYGQSFTNSWMYDNGIISFREPGTAGAVSPWQWNAPASLSQAGSSYYIAPLWTDLAPTTNTVYSTNSDGTYLKYSWNNVSEYYSGGTRFSSFSTTIRPDGSINSIYNSIDITQSNVITGYVGDVSKGEVTQLYQANAGTLVSTGSIANWSYTPADPCAADPMSSPSCPGYLSALSKLLPAPLSESTTSTTSTTPTGTVTVEVIDSTVSPAVTVSTSSTAVSNPTLASSPAARESSSGGNTALGLSIIARNQQREQNIVNQTVQTAITSANDAARASQQEAAAVAATAVVNSTSSNAAGMGTAGGIGIRVSSSSAVSSSAAGLDAALGPDSASRVSNMLTDRTNPLNEYIEPRATQNNNLSSAGPAVNRNAANNEAAGGVDIAKMAVAPAGYADYLNLALKDAAFYAPREVYQNQRTVDNARALRQISSDRLHQQMIEQQYRSPQ